MKLFEAHTPRANVVIRAFGVMVISCLWMVQAAQANDFEINEIIVDGNRRIETETIRSYTEIETPALLTTGEVNDAVQRVRASNLFESVSAEVQGKRLKVTVVEFPTVNEVVFEGNDRLGDKQLSALVRSQSRRVYSVSQVRDDANAIAEAYANQGRIAACITIKVHMAIDKARENKLVLKVDKRRACWAGLIARQDFDNLAIADDHGGWTARCTTGLIEQPSCMNHRDLINSLSGHRRTRKQKRANRNENDFLHDLQTPLSARCRIPCAGGSCGGPAKHCATVIH